MITHPEKLITSDDFKELSKEAASNFLSRIQYIAEIRDNLTLWLKGEPDYDYQSIGDFLTDLELDAIVNQGTPSGEAEKCLSNWLVHSSWGDEIVIFSPKNVDDEIINLIEQPLPSVFSTDQSIEEWLKVQCTLLDKSLDMYEKSVSYIGVLNALLVINTSMATLMAGLYRLRFIHSE